MTIDKDRSSESIYLFDGQSVYGWRMAGPGKFVLVESEKFLAIRRRSGIIMVY